MSLSYEECLVLAPRPDGMCLRCPTRPAKAFGKRLCGVCNHQFVKSYAVPIFRPRGRSAGQRQAADFGDSNPWQENAVKALEE